MSPEVKGQFKPDTTGLIHPVTWSFLGLPLVHSCSPTTSCLHKWIHCILQTCLLLMSTSLLIKTRKLLGELRLIACDSSSNCVYFLHDTSLDLSPHPIITSSVDSMPTPTYLVNEYHWEIPTQIHGDCWGKWWCLRIWPCRVILVVWWCYNEYANDED